MRRLVWLIAIASALASGCTQSGAGRQAAGGEGTTPVAGEAGGAPAAGGAKVRSPSRIGAQEAAAMVERGEAVLVDVREERELARGMAAPAIWIPTSEIGRDGPAWRSFVESQPRERTLIFYCAVGGRSQYAAVQLAEKGYRTANLGGFSEWVNAGLPVRTPEHPEVGK